MIFGIFYLGHYDWFSSHSILLSYLSGYTSPLPEQVSPEHASACSCVSILPPATFTLLPQIGHLTICHLPRYPDNHERKHSEHSGHYEYDQRVIPLDHVVALFWKSRH